MLDLFQPFLADAGGSFWMPPEASTVAGEIDGLFYFITWLSAIFFVAIIGAMVYFAWKYRRRTEDQRTSPIEGHRNLEILWSAIPGVLLFVIFVWGFRSWVTLNVPPNDALDVRVTGQQWSWSFDYPSVNCVGIPNEMVVPVNTPVRLTMRSNDVLHSFYVADFRIKRDVIPGRYTVQWFEATREGDYHIQCAEYCGAAEGTPQSELNYDHSTMRGMVRVVSQEAYDEWVKSGCGIGPGDLSLPEWGEKLFTQHGCTACHSVDGTPRVGPSMRGIYGKTETLASGAPVEVDDNYIRESILTPNAKVVQGFQPTMPPFGGRLQDRQIEAIIEYIKSLSQ